MSTYEATEASHVIIQCSIAQNFKTNGINDYCFNLKRNQKSFGMYKYLKIWHFHSNIKPRSNRKNKAEKNMFEAQTFIHTKL